jgi:hypothetical protein
MLLAKGHKVRASRSSRRMVALLSQVPLLRAFAQPI